MKTLFRARMLAPSVALAAFGGALLQMPTGARAVGGSDRAYPAFTAEQARAGQAVYEARCQACHGAALEGGAGPALAGRQFVDLWASGRKSLADLRYIIGEMMPLQQPGSLKPEEYDQIVAYIMAKNGYEAGKVALDKTTTERMLAPPPGHQSAATTGGPSAVFPSVPSSVGVATTQRPTDADLLAPGADTWLVYNGRLDGARFSALDQVNTANAKSLAPVCMFQVGEIGAFQASPIVYEGVMYITSPYSTFALDAKSCTKLWQHDYTPVDTTMPVVLSRGVAIYKGKLFRITPNGHVFALDAKTGKMLWDVWMADPAKGYWLSGAPVAFDGKVFVGEAGADWGSNSHIRAFDADTGKLVWTFNVIPTGKEFGANTWGKGAEHGGGSWWSTFAIDPATHQLYFSVGNPAPDYVGAMRPGDNLFTDSVVAVDYRTGERVWHAQQVPHDIHDWDTAAAPALYAQDGKRYMTVANKGGWNYIYDRDTHKLVAKTEVSPHENVDTPNTPQGTHHCPGIIGGVEWNGPAYSPATKLLYVNSVNWCGTTTLTEARYIEGSSYFGGRHVWDPAETARGYTRALDAATGKEVWVREFRAPMLAALTPTAGGVVFTGDLDGNFLTLDAKTGQTLYSFNTGGAVAGTASTYLLDGRQFVAVTSGNSSRSVWRTGGAATVVVFALPKKD